MQYLLTVLPSLKLVGGSLNPPLLVVEKSSTNGF